MDTKPPKNGYNWKVVDVTTNKDVYHFKHLSEAMEAIHSMGGGYSLYHWNASFQHWDYKAWKEMDASRED